MKLTDPITVLRGVGPRRARALGQLDIRTIGDLLNHYPSRVEFPPEDQLLGGLETGTVQTAVGKVGRVYTGRHDRDFACSIATHLGEEINVRWFNTGSYMHGLVQRGTGIMLFGKYGGLGTEFTNPEFRVFPASSKPDLSNLRIVTYPVTSGITSREISRYAKQVLHLASPNVRAIHDPTDQEIYDKAVRGEKYDELFYMQLALAIRSKRRKESLPNVQCIPTPKAIEDYFPFKFTGDQRQAIWDIHGDICGSHAMNRLLQGDVGSGKTAVAAYAAMVVACNGGQTAILCPTQVLAEQHYKTLKDLFGSAGLKCELLTGPVRHTDPYVQQDVVIGTTAILGDVQWNDLGLVVVDEQHKFGVEQRAKLREHGNPHVLLMTATPIPRTIAMTAFGDLDVSIIKDMPPGRKPVETDWIRTEERADLMNSRIEFELARGNQVYVVCPRIEALDDEMRAVEEVVEEYKRRFPGAGATALHGQMHPADKKRVADEFMAGEFQILVATTVVEVGVDCPNATVMVIEGAERFGLAQLHQLRGRVGRSEKQSYCFLLSDTDSLEGRARLKAMEGTNSGFEIAEQDIRLRGPGDLLSTRQHGLPELKIADLVTDYDLMVEARDQARNLVACDRHSPHLQELGRRYGDVLHLGDTG